MLVEKNEKGPKFPSSMWYCKSGRTLPKGLTYRHNWYISGQERTIQQGDTAVHGQTLNVLSHRCIEENGGTLLMLIWALPVGEVVCTYLLRFATKIKEAQVLGTSYII